MNKKELDSIAGELRLMEDFLGGCDDGLADEIGGRDKISGRIIKSARELTALRREIELLASDK